MSSVEENELIRKPPGRLEQAFKHGGEGIAAVGRELEDLDNRLRLERHDTAGSVIGQWLEGRRYRARFS